MKDPPIARRTCHLTCVNVMEWMGLKIKEQMILEINNKTAGDLTHNWSLGCRTLQVEVHYEK
jgi:hypothetical protein